MGIPFLYRYLVERYPCCVAPVSERTLPATDHLFFDLNGILHNCTHAADATVSTKPADCAPDAVAHRVCAKVLEVIMVVRPKHLIYVAIDGVAPRAKMNQQRSRRYKAGFAHRKGTRRSADKGPRARQAVGLPPLPEGPQFDTNAITPGTPFMHAVADALRPLLSAAVERMPALRGLKIVFSTSQTPGEGEHKIMDFLRATRFHGLAGPSPTHCLYGNDADLVMLALAARDPHIVVLRELAGSRRQFSQRLNPQPPAWCPQLLSPLENAMGAAVGEGHWPLNRNHCRLLLDSTPSALYEFMHVSLLRAYLDRDFRHHIAGVSALPPKAAAGGFARDTPAGDSTADAGAGAGAGAGVDSTDAASSEGSGFVYSLDRCIDDFVLLCMLVGNDFLPPLPGFSILDNGLDCILRVYFANVPSIGYIVDMDAGDAVSGVLPPPATGDAAMVWNIDFSRLQRFLSCKDILDVESAMTSTLLHAVTRLHDLQDGVSDSFEEDDGLADDSWFLDGDSDCGGTDGAGVMSPGAADVPVYKRDYYGDKMNVRSSAILDVVAAYCTGLCWVMQYYYRGVPSWSWFYPHHYAPFVSDLVDLPAAMAREPALCQRQWYRDAADTPLLPLQQLLAVLSPDSASLIPPPYRRLMLAADDDGSGLRRFYPDYEDVVEDVEDTDFDWQSVLQLPFIDQKALLAATTAVQSELSPEDAARNTLADPQVLGLSGLPPTEWRPVKHHVLASTVFAQTPVPPPTVFPVFHSPMTPPSPPPSWPVAGLLHSAAVDFSFRASVDVFGSRSQRSAMVLHDPHPTVQVQLDRLRAILPAFTVEDAAAPDPLPPTSAPAPAAAAPAAPAAPAPPPPPPPALPAGLQAATGAGAGTGLVGDGGGGAGSVPRQPYVPTEAEARAVAHCLLGRLVVVGFPVACEGVIVSMCSKSLCAALPGCTRDTLAQGSAAAFQGLGDREWRRRTLPPSAGVDTLSRAFTGDVQYRSAASSGRFFTKCAESVAEASLRKSAVDSGPAANLGFVFTVQTLASALHRPLSANAVASSFVGFLPGQCVEVTLHQLLRTVESSAQHPTTFEHLLSVVPRPLLPPEASREAGGAALLLLPGRRVQVSRVVDDTAVVALYPASPTPPPLHLSIPPSMSQFVSGSDIYFDTGVDRRVVHLMTSSCLVKYEPPKRGYMDLALFVGFPSTAEGLWVPGFCRHSTTRQAKHLLLEYRRRFPKLFELAHSSPRRMPFPARYLVLPVPDDATGYDDVYDVSTPEAAAVAAEANAMVDAAQQWLSTLPSYGLPRFHRTTKALPAAVVARAKLGPLLDDSPEMAPVVERAGVDSAIPPPPPEAGAGAGPEATAPDTGASGAGAGAGAGAGVSGTNATADSAAATPGAASHTAPPALPIAAEPSHVLHPLRTGQLLCDAAGSSLPLRLGDRVVVMSEWTQLPFGTTGTIVSIHKCAVPTSPLLLPSTRTRSSSSSGRRTTHDNATTTGAEPSSATVERGHSSSVGAGGVVNLSYRHRVVGLLVDWSPTSFLTPPKSSLQYKVGRRVTPDVTQGPTVYAVPAGWVLPLPVV